MNEALQHLIAAGEFPRAALLLDMGRGALRRASFGPEVAYEVSLSRGESPVQWVAPFSGGILDVRAESQDGLWAASLLARAAAFLRVPGGSRGRWSAALSLERVLVAVNDVPVALFAEAGGRGGSGEAALEASVGLRLDFQR